MMLGIRAVGLRYGPLTPRLIQRSGMHGNPSKGSGSLLLLDLSQPFAASKPRV